jgi:hypothetical protein
VLAALGWSLLAAYALHVEDVAGVPSETGAAIEAAFSAALKKRGEVVRDADRAHCAGDRSCAAAIASRTRAEQVVLFSVIGGVTELRVIVELLDASGGARAHEEARLVGLPRAEDLADRMGELAGRLLPRVAIESARAAVAQAPPPIVERRGPRVLPWLLIAAGVGAVATAGGLSIEGYNLRAETGSELRFGDPALSAKVDASTRDRRLAVGLLAGGVTAALSGVVVALLLD